MKYSKILSYARELRNNQTKAEKFFWSKVRNRLLSDFKFNRQYIIEYENSGYFIVDCYCHEKKLIVEIDGKIHLKKLDEDQNREAMHKEMGYNVLRLKNEEVLNDWINVEIKLLQQLTPTRYVGPLSSKERESNT